MKSERPKIPVEPLSESRWARIDDAVLSALDEASTSQPPASLHAVGAKNARRPRVLLAVAAVVAVAAGLVLVLRSGGTAPVALPASPSAAVVNPSHIETGDTPSRLAVGESTIEVGPSSAVVASGDDVHGVLVVVEKGKVECEVTPRKARPPFVVQAGNVRVRVIGTRFVVSRDAGSVSVAVTHGAVEVSRGAEVIVLHDGESWPRGEPVPGVVEPPPASAPTARLVVPSARPAATAAASQDPQKAYEMAAKSEASDPDAAMAAYRRLSSSGGPWAPTALFAAGRLASDRGRNADAKKLLEDYLARYPQGANAEDARRILARVR